MSNSNNRKRSFEDLEADEVMASPLFTMKSRKNDFNERTWWMVDLDCSIGSNQGATALVKRCMRNYGWSLDKTKGILKAYRQFLTLKKELEDWYATILSPSHLVDQMWHQHILDIGNYYHDMILLCGGQIELHNPDGALDREAKKSRDETTRSALIQKFGSENVDREVWGFPTQPATIFVQDASNHRISLRVNQRTSMMDVKREYANRRGISSTNDFRFSYHGKSITRNDTPQTLKMEEGDTIDMILYSDNPKITIRIKDQNDKETFFKIKNRTIQMGRVFAAYANREKKAISDLRFLFDADRIKHHDTPQSLELDDDEQIDVLLSCGGC